MTTNTTYIELLKLAHESLDSKDKHIEEVKRHLNISECMVDNLRCVKAEMEAERYLKEKRIAELEKELSSIVAGLFSENELAIIKLEQQAKGIQDATEISKIPYGRNGFGFQMYMCSRNSLLECRDKLLIQAVALKGQDND
jgi:hypothetical protein